MTEDVPGTGIDEGATTLAQLTYLAALEVDVLELDRRVRACGGDAAAGRRASVLDVDSVHNERSAVAEGEDLGSIRRIATAPAAAQRVLAAVLGRDRDGDSSRLGDRAVVGDGDVVGELHGCRRGGCRRLLQAGLIEHCDLIGKGNMGVVVDW